MPVIRPLAATALSEPTQKDLAKRQKTANKYAVNDKRIGNAWKRFSGTPARNEVEIQLDAAFHSKCAYCEIILPRDIEHFYPKSRFPKRMFQWNNYLRACKNCNTEKLDTFDIVGGSPVLLDPCTDEPSEFLTWDLDTGLPILNSAPERHTRAEATVKMFGLRNQQLCEERRVRARNFLFFLLQSVEENPSPPDVHQWLLDELKPERPWRSVLRQIVRDPERADLIAEVKRTVPGVEPYLAALAA